MSDLLKPDQIFAGRYRVVAFLAKGGFGAVYSAEQIDTEGKVALKVLWPHLLDSDAAVEQFKLEAKLSNRIASEHVVRVYDVGQEVGTGKVYLSMELLEGKDFDQLVKESGPVAPRKALVYFRQIASALEKAHNYVDRAGEPRPIVHRDLKPENLFLTHRETGEPCVKLLDFGLAKVLGESGRISNEFKGTPLFMSYEQASVGPITPQTDIWCFGLIAFYLLTGRCYWLASVDADTPVTRIFSEVLSGPMSAPSERARSLGAGVIPSAAFDAWFSRAVTRNAARRFGSITECMAELEVVLEAMATTAPSPPSPPSAPDTSSAAGSGFPPENALATLKSARPPSGETTSPQSFDLEQWKKPPPLWRGLTLVALVGALIGAGLWLARPASGGASGLTPSSGPAGTKAGNPAAARDTAAPRASAVRLPALPLPQGAADAGAGARPAESARGGEHSAGSGKNTKPPSPFRATTPAAPPPPAPSSEPEEDPYGSR